MGNVNVSQWEWSHAKSSADAIAQKNQSNAKKWVRQLDSLCIVISTFYMFPLLFIGINLLLSFFLVAFLLLSCF